MSLIERTKTSLDEARMLMLGAQVLLGFEFQAPFQPNFEALGFREQIGAALAIGLMIVVVGLLIYPSAVHRIVERGRASTRLVRTIDRVAGLTLAPFALALAISLAIACTRVLSPAAAMTAGAVVGLVAMASWYSPALVSRRAPAMSDHEPTPLDKKVEFVLTEARVVLPGVQALLGFQLIIVFSAAFDRLDGTERLLHLVALGFICLSTIALMAPAAYHRLAFGGAVVPRVHRVASFLVVIATALLAIGLAVEIHVVVHKVFGNTALSVAAGVVTGLFLIGIWHLWPLLQRR